VGAGNNGTNESDGFFSGKVMQCPMAKKTPFHVSLLPVHDTKDRYVLDSLP
jgi:hypothetical protein